MPKKYGLIGTPLGHSISAIIHKAGLKSLGIEASYELLDTAPEALIPRIKYLKANSYDGFNITIPLKVPMKLFIDKFDETANITSCVNTVKIDENKEFTGYNTDVYGFKKAIPEYVQEAIKEKNACILGTGGAARAATVGLVELGVKQISFFSRNIVNALPTIEYFKKTFPDVNFNLFQKSSKGELFNSSIIVNATPTGMKGHSADEMPLSENTIKNLSKDTVIYDIIYNPYETLLVKCANSYGLETITGLDMLLYQAIKAQEIWLGETPSFDKMKLAAIEELR